MKHGNIDSEHGKPLPSWLVLSGVIGLRYLCHCIMLIPVLLHELKPAPTLPDFLLSHIAYVPQIARWNYVIWILCYIPPACYLLVKNKPLFFLFIFADGAMALLRGAMIPLTGLGPTLGADVNALHPFDFWTTWLAIINPISAIAGNTAGVYLTKDLFFSGHIASTFLVYLFSRKLGGVSRIFLGLHFLCLITVLLAHLHYGIDIIGAYAIAYCVYRIACRPQFWKRTGRLKAEDTKN